MNTSAAAVNIQRSLLEPKRVKNHGENLNGDIEVNLLVQKPVQLKNKGKNDHSAYLDTQGDKKLKTSKSKSSSHHNSSYSQLHALSRQTYLAQPH